MIRLSFILSLLLSINVIAIDLIEFESPEHEAQFKELTAELRCPVCQNQNLADSGAGLADDLREEIYNQVTAGNDNKTIIDFMVQRYGDFIIYRPQLKPVNYLLWFGPALFLLLGLFLLYRQIKKQNSATMELSEAEQQELKSILNKIDDKH